MEPGPGLEVALRGARTNPKEESTMGLFDKLKKTAQDALNNAVPQREPEPVAATSHQPYEAEDQGEDQHEEEQQSSAPAKQYDGPTFYYDGDTLPMPPGWDGLAVEDWFFKLESLRERMMHADDETLAPM